MQHRARHTAVMQIFLVEVRWVIDKNSSIFVRWAYSNGIFQTPQAPSGVVSRKKNEQVAPDSKR
jgi:hypothetical protein